MLGLFRINVSFSTLFYFVGWFVEVLCVYIFYFCIYPIASTHTHINCTTVCTEEGSSRRRCWHDDEQKTNVALDPNAAGFKERRVERTRLRLRRQRRRLTRLGATPAALCVNTVPQPQSTSLLFCASSTKYNGEMEGRRRRRGAKEAKGARATAREGAGAMYVHVHVHV